MLKNSPMSHFLVRNSEKTTIDAIKALIDEFCLTFSFNYLTYYAIDAPMIEDNTYLITNYPNNWQSHYFESEYQKIDPVLNFSRGRLTPLDWRHLPPQKGKGENFFSDARKHGLGNFGMTAPIRGQYGELVLVSVNANSSVREWSETWQHAIPDYTFFAYLLHMRILCAIGAANKPVPRLSRQEAEIMRWAVRGKSAWETGKLMDLTERTVQFYFTNIYAKLEVATKTQAVARVVREHLIPL